MNSKASRMRERHTASEVTGRGTRMDDRAAYVRAAYRLRFELGPTLSRSTLSQVRREQEELAARLLAEGVSPRLLGLDD